MLAIPGVGRHVPIPAFVAVDAVRGADRPAARCAAGRLEPRLGRRRLPPRLELALDQVEQRRVTLGQVRRLGEPVVHLDVDVRVIIAMPRRIVAVAPQSLQIRRQPARPRARDQEIPPVLKHQRFQIGIAAMLGIDLLPPVRRQADPVGRRVAKVERHPIEERLIIGDMLRF